MNRKIIYTGQIPLSGIELGFEKNVEIALGQMFRDLALSTGSPSVMAGLPLTATSPASLQLLLGVGAIYQPGQVDYVTTAGAGALAAYGSLAADTTSTTLQGIQAVAATLPAFLTPGTAGQSINYLVQFQQQTQDATPIVLTYQNSASTPQNPLPPVSGPGGLGASQNTERLSVLVYQVVAGTAAATGTQTTPATSAGWLPGYVVTVPFGATTLTAANIAIAPLAPFLASLTSQHHLGIPGTAPKINLATEAQGQLLDAQASAHTALTNVQNTFSVPQFFGAAGTSAIQVVGNTTYLTQNVFNNGTNWVLVNAANPWAVSAIDINGHEYLYGGPAVVGGNLGPTLPTTVLGNWSNGVTNPLYGYHQLGGQARVQAIATPAAPTVTPTGTAGATTAYYWLVAQDRNGNKTLIGPAGNTTTGNAALTAGNYNALAWAAVPGATKYDILKTATNVAPTGTVTVALATGIAATTYSDVGGTLTSYTVPTRNSTADVVVDGQLTANGAVVGGGVTSLTAGTGISLSGSSGAVTITSSSTTSSAAVGTTASPSTTLSIGSYVLPDPRISVNVASGQKVVIDSFVELQNTTANADVFVQFARSADGGTTWTMLGSKTGANLGSASSATTVALSYADTPGIGTFLYGISLGTSGTGTAVAAGTLRGLRTILVNG
jgi:hypothetical protein